MKKHALGTALALALALAPVAFAQPAAAQATAPGYMIANYDIKDPALFQKYMDAAGSLAAKYNGKVTVFNLHANAVEGKARSVMAIAEFPSVAEAQRFYNSPEYIEARKFRVAGTEGTVVITEGFVAPAK